VGDRLETYPIDYGIDAKSATNLVLFEPHAKAQNTTNVWKTIHFLYPFTDTILVSQSNAIVGAWLTWETVTNTSERFPTHSEPMSPPPGYELLALAFMKDVPDANPTNKWVRTTVKTVRKLSFEWQGHREITAEEVLSDVEVEMRKRVRTWTTPDEGRLEWWECVSTNNIKDELFSFGEWHGPFTYITNTAVLGSN
jgi:hypothetical protein